MASGWCAAADMSSMTAQQIEALPAVESAQAVQAAIDAQRIDVLTALTTSNQKALAKLAKKGLYQLKSKGVAIPEAAPSAPRPSVTAPVAPEEPPSLLSSIIGTGERAMLFARAVKGQGLESYQCVLSDTLGLLDMTRLDLSRGDYKKQLKAIRANPQGSLEVPFNRAIEELQHALFLHQKADTGLPNADAESLVRRLGLTPKERVSPALPAAKPQPSQAQRLHREREIVSWLPPEPMIRVLLQRMDEVRLSPLQLSETQRVEQSRKKLEQTASEFATPDIRALYSHRLVNMAEVFEATGRAEMAQVARDEAALLLAHPDSAPAPFFVVMFEKVLVLSAQAAAIQAAKAQSEGTPEQAPEATAERRSPGGLILP